MLSPAVIVAIVSLMFSIVFSAITNWQKHKERQENLRALERQQAIRETEDRKDIQNYFDKINKVNKEINQKIDDFRTENKEQINELKLDIKSQEKSTNELRMEFTETKILAKSAHQRIDDIMGFIKGDEKNGRIYKE